MSIFHIQNISLVVMISVFFSDKISILKLDRWIQSQPMRISKVCHTVWTIDVHFAVLD